MESWGEHAAGSHFAPIELGSYASREMFVEAAQRRLLLQEKQEQPGHLTTHMKLLQQLRLDWRSQLPIVHWELSPRCHRRSHDRQTECREETALPEHWLAPDTNDATQAHLLQLTHVKSPLSPALAERPTHLRGRGVKDDQRNQTMQISERRRG